MLCLKRNLNEAILIGDTIKVVVIKVEDGAVIIGVDAPRDIPVDREEIRVLKNLHEVKQ